jgi:hypothetical protein
MKFKYFFENYLINYSFYVLVLYQQDIYSFL